MHALPARWRRLAATALAAATAAAITLLPAGTADHPHAPVLAADTRPAATAQKIPARWYTIRPGDTLTRIAVRECGPAADWTGLFHANRQIIGPDPDLILTGQRLILACYDPPVTTTAARAPARDRDGDRPGHAYGHPWRCGDGDRDGWDLPCGTRNPAPAPVQAASSGTYSYTALENLWITAGGSPATAAHAACIAEHESGGRPWAISPTGDWGLWQIHAGGYPMLNPYANARRAIAMSADGTNWSPWTTARYC